MNILYLAIFNSKIDREQLKVFLDTLSGVTNWFYSMPNSIFIVSTLTAAELFTQIENKFGQNRFFLTEVHQINRQGRMPTEHWDIVSSLNSVDTTPEHPKGEIK